MISCVREGLKIWVVVQHHSNLRQQSRSGKMQVSNAPEEVAG
jgi:hypothetical protein